MESFSKRIGAKRLKLDHSCATENTFTITDLPLELGAILICFLDTEAKINAYKIPELRKYFTRRHVRQFVMRSSFASVATLEEDIVKDLGLYIQHLDLNGISITTASFQPYVKQLSNLKSLDVACTDIRLEDIELICPEKLRNISIDFFHCPERVSLRTWNCCLDVFKARMFEEISFTVFNSSLYYLYGDNSLSHFRFLMSIPHLSKVKTVDFTRLHWRHVYNTLQKEIMILNYEQFTYISIPKFVHDRLDDDFDSGDENHNNSGTSDEEHSDSDSSNDEELDDSDSENDGDDYYVSDSEIDSGEEDSGPDFEGDPYNIEFFNNIEKYSANAAPFDIEFIFASYSVKDAKNTVYTSPRLSSLFTNMCNDCKSSSLINHSVRDRPDVSRWVWKSDDIVVFKAWKKSDTDFDKKMLYSFLDIVRFP